jgi:hypothetical protein
MRKMCVVLAIGTGKSAVIAESLRRLVRAGLVSQPMYLTDTNVAAAMMVNVLNEFDVGGGLRLGMDVPIRRLEPGLEERPASITVATVSMLLRMSRVGQTNETLRNTDLVIVDGNFARAELNVANTANRTPSWKAVIERLGVVSITFLPTLDAGAATEPPIFAYDLHRAVEDGVVVGPQTIDMQVRAGGWPSFNRDDPTHARRQVLLEAMPPDRDAAARVAAGLRDAGVHLIFHPADSDDVDDVAAVERSKLSKGDVLVITLSSQSQMSPAMYEDLAASLERRGVDIVPILVDHCTVPQQLAARSPVDATSGVGSLLRRLQAGAMVDVTRLGPLSLLNLARDLLTRLHFTAIAEPPDPVDQGYDLTATFQDPDRFGLPRRYLVTIKANAVARASYQAVRMLVSIADAAGPDCAALMITNGILTTVAQREVDAVGPHVRVIDGPQLHALILRNPDLIDAYFGRESS